MKAILFFVSTVLLLSTYGQNTSPIGARSQKRTSNNTITQGKSANAQGRNNATQTAAPRQTVTERYLNGPERKSSATKNSTTNNAANNNPATNGNSTNASPFVGGVYAGGNAGKTFDTLNTSNNVNRGNNTSSTTIRGGNDTTFNANTINNGGITTNSGAVDRSGQSQFGQTNWGSSRSTVGESQWTVPPPITASFNKQFPEANTATWTRNNVDTSIFSARYKSGVSWVTTNYNAAGQRLDMRTEYPLPQAPRPVSVFIAKQPANFEVVSIYKVEIQGKPDMYEVQTRNGKTIYVNNDGMEVNY